MTRPIDRYQPIQAAEVIVVEVNPYRCDGDPSLARYRASVDRPGLGEFGAGDDAHDPLDALERFIAWLKTPRG